MIRPYHFHIEDVEEPLACQIGVPNSRIDLECVLMRVKHCLNKPPPFPFPFILINGARLGII